MATDVVLYNVEDYWERPGCLSFDPLKIKEVSLIVCGNGYERDRVQQSIPKSYSADKQQNTVR
jgi:hypothetical protein